MYKGKTMRPLSKSKLLAYRQCAKRLWLEVNGPKPPAPDAQTQARFDDGHAVGKLAQRLYDPKGKGEVFDPGNDGYDEIVERTAAFIDSSKPLFEAGFSIGDARAFVDVMLPLRRGGQKVWHMVEVKSSTSVKDTHKDDIAIQATIARESGVKLHSAAVAHINSKWVYPGGGDYDGFLTEVDQTEKAFSRGGEVKEWITAAQAIVRKRKEPKMDVGSHCNEPYACAFLAYCQRDAVAAEYPVEWLPHPSPTLTARLDDERLTDLSDVPDGYLNAQQLRVKTHTLAGTVFFEAAAAARALAPHKPPAYFLDFETINLTIPIWKGIKPFQQIPFQFSLHCQRARGKLTHVDFLDLSGKDPSRKLALTLIASCGESGPIFVYSAFEKTVIRALTERWPPLAHWLLPISERIVDLLPIAKAHYYHPDQQGSWSIKNVLPTIAPDLNYDTLDGVKDGGMAILAYREAINPATTAARKKEIERQLLDYCRLDTFAMVRLWQHFTGRKPSPL
jgi:hypothetical protein